MVGYYGYGGKPFSGDNGRKYLLKIHTNDANPPIMEKILVVDPNTLCTRSDITGGWENATIPPEWHLVGMQPAELELDAGL